MKRLQWGILTLLAGVALAACGGARDTGPRDATQESLASAAQRLAGKWRLVRYDPDVPMQPTVALLVKSQVGQMIVTIAGETLTAEGPGLSVTRRLRIGSAYGDHFDAQLIDSYGVANDTSDEFQGKQLIVVVLGTTWGGKALLQRVEQ
jgi:hypothetical protein